MDTKSYDQIEKTIQEGKLWAFLHIQLYKTNDESSQAEISEKIRELYEGSECLRRMLDAYLPNIDLAISMLSNRASRSSDQSSDPSNYW